jgi:hypothetical protein
MQREERYLVVKYKDMATHLTVDEQIALIELAKKVDAGRKSDGKHEMQCVVVEHDWPEYEEVWAMLASRVDGVPLYKARIGIETHNADVISLAPEGDKS